MQHIYVAFGDMNVIEFAYTVAQKLKIGFTFAFRKHIYVAMFKWNSSNK